jgi:hypothetical protein
MLQQTPDGPRTAENCRATTHLPYSACDNPKLVTFAQGTVTNALPLGALSLRPLVKFRRFDGGESKIQIAIGVRSLSAIYEDAHLHGLVT